MVTTTEKKNKNRVVGKIDTTRVSRGHVAIPSGSIHHDRRLKRQKTRSNRDRSAFSDW